MKEESKEPTVTLYDVIKKQEELEEEAEFQQNQNWGSLDKCTRDEGYIRQPLYSCKTCATEKPIGVCFGCCMNCHVDHEIVELFDKRNFKCDCGTPRSGCKCDFHPNDTLEDNIDNVYNHNFYGKYCWCDGSYDEKEMIMYQCTLCLDWFHFDCIQKKESHPIPAPDVPCDFICEDCVKSHQFLAHYYSNYQVSVQEGEKEITAPEKDYVCKLEYLPTETSLTKNTFWKKVWREELCQCPTCLETYEKEKVMYLLTEKEEDAEEETEEPEEEITTPAVKRSISLVDASEQAFLNSNTIPYTAKIDMMHAYQDLQQNLKSFLAGFASSGKEVTKEDVNGFFDQLRNTKRRKFD